MVLFINVCHTKNEAVSVFFEWARTHIHCSSSHPL